MLSRTSERKLLSVRAALLLGWLVLIGSLLWDPFSSVLTEPGNLLSPFHIQYTTYNLDGSSIPVTPYPLGNRIFWTMLIPLLPLFLMLFGHEAWRRVCPLSFASQLPRYFGWQRRRTVTQASGRTERKPYLMARDGWMKRNAWYVQFGLLYAGLTARLLILNSDRLALAAALLGIIAAAIVVGFLWGGKTWCNFICPVNIVQRIYTEPRGLLESAPHLHSPAIPQSMCRNTSRHGDKPACEGCIALCGDIDLERSYWETIESRNRRIVYYMFPGLILGFYGFYYLYAGRWDYYFSGIWTHENGAVGRLFAPIAAGPLGLIGLPKIAAAPLVLAAGAMLSLLAGLLLERSYRAIRRHRPRATEAEAINHCLAVSAYASINLFYVFGGRPNLLLLPPLVTHGIDLLILALTTLWLLQTLSRTPLRYRRESVASSLLEQLRKLKIDISRYLEGRTLDDLRPDEIYLLSKVLPAVSHEDKLAAYRNLLDDAITTGKTGYSHFPEALNEIRSSMGVSDDEHAQVIEQIGDSADADFTPQNTTAYEKALCIQNYNELVGAAVANQMPSGKTLAEIIQTPDVQSLIKVLRASFKITDAEHAQMLARLTTEEGVPVKRLEASLETVRDLAGARFCVQALGTDDEFRGRLEAILVGAIEQRLHHLVSAMLPIMHGLGTSPWAQWTASCLVQLDQATAQSVLMRQVHRDRPATWKDRLDHAIVAILASNAKSSVLTGHELANTPTYTYRDVINAGMDLPRCLRMLAGEDDPFTSALAIAAFSYLDQSVTRDYVVGLVASGLPTDHWLLTEVVETVIGGESARESRLASHRLHVGIETQETAPQVRTFTGPVVTLGSAPGNDIVLRHDSISPYHLAIHHAGDDVWIERLDRERLFVDGIECLTGSLPLSGGARLSFSEPPEVSPVLVLNWRHGGAQFTVQPWDTVTKMVWLSGSYPLNGCDLAILANMARRAEVRRYAADARVCHRGDPAEHAFFLRLGLADITDGGEPKLPAQRLLSSEAPFSCWVLPSNGTYQASVAIASEFAIIIAISDRDDLDVLSERITATTQQTSESPNARSPGESRELVPE